MLTLAELEHLGPAKRFRGMDLARVPGQDAEVLIKVFPDAAALPESSRYQFRAEAERYGRLKHPNLVKLLAVDVDDEQGLYLILEQPRGRSLGRRVREGGPIRPDEAIELITRVALALHYLHAHGLVHRNVAPRSIWVEDDDPVLGDPALLRDLDPRSVSVKSGRYRGRPEIWAPEQAADQPDALTPATDVYGLGATLYAMLVGEAPFADVDELDREAAILSRPPTPPSVLRPGLPKALDAVCLRCLEKDPARRYPSAGAVADDLGRLVRDEPLLLVEDTRPFPVVLELLVVLLAVGSMVCVWLAWDARSALQDRAFELHQARDALSERDRRLAALRQELADAQRALTAARAALPQGPSPEARRAAEARFTRGFEATLAGDYERAIADFDAVLKVLPQHARALVNRGYAHSRLGRHTAAIADFDRALAIDAELTEAWSNRGNSRQALGQLELAILDYDRALQIQPDYGRAWANRATARYKLGEFERAAADCDRALALDAEDAAALACRGLSLLELGNAEQARQDLTRSLRLAPEHPRSDALRAALERASLDGGE